MDRIWIEFRIRLVIKSYSFASYVQKKIIFHDVINALSNAAWFDGNLKHWIELKQTDF